MRIVVVGILLGAGLVVAAGVQRPSAYAQRGPIDFADRSAATGLIALTMDIGEGRQQITLVDPRARVMAVYHVERNSGEIALKSVRNVNWDLQMDEFNGESPSPREIRSLLQQR